MSARLGSSLLGGGAAYTDAQAVSALVAFRDFDFDFYVTPLIIATPTLTSYRLVTTNSLAAGTWQLTVETFVTGSNSGTEIGVELEIDGAPLGLVLSSSVVVGGGYIQSTTVPVVWAAGVHTIEYLISQPGGPGQVTAVDAITTWARET